MFPEQLSVGAEINPLIPYLTDLEVEVDRLRRQSRFIEHEVSETLRRIRRCCADAGQPENVAQALFDIESDASELGLLLRDLRQQPGYHPAMDQVVAIAVRPVMEQVFRWHQRLQGASEVALRFELDIDHLEWFPARFRHIVDGLIGNALQHGHPAEGQARVSLALRLTDAGYELRVTDNGPGLSLPESHHILELVYRAGPARAASLGVGLAVTKLLIEQSGGSLTIDSVEGRGTTCVAVLPVFGARDFLEGSSLCVTG